MPDRARPFFPREPPTPPPAESAKTLIDDHGRTVEDRELKFGVRVRVVTKCVLIDFRPNRVIYSISCPGPVFFKCPPRAND